MTKIKYNFTAPLWKHEDEGGWFFVSFPKDISKEIRENLQWQEEGWGRMRASARIGNIDWDTAIWFDTKRDTYLLPVKADVRRKLGIAAGDEVEVEVSI